MKRSIIGLITGFIFTGSLALLSWAGDNPMPDFYNGLAEIIERNIDNPAACAAQAEDYIKTNIGWLQKAAARGKAMARQNMQRYEEMSPEEIESAMKEAERAMSDPKVAEAMNSSMTALNKFMEAMEKFTMRHPEEGDRIMDILDQYAPKDEMY